MFSESGLLFLIFLPILSGTLLLVQPKNFSPRFFKSICLALSLLPLILLSNIWNTTLDITTSIPWWPSQGLALELRLDPLAFIFILLTVIIIPYSILAFPSSTQGAARFYPLTLILEGLLIGLFLSQNLLLFTIFWESTLLPLFFIIALWTDPNQSRSSTPHPSHALRFLLYMLAGSILMISAVAALYVNGNTLSISELTQKAESLPYASWICLIFILAFAVKTPLVPFHGWLPPTYVAAPTAGSILLAGILSKAGIYGFLRIVITLFPTLFYKEWALPFLLLAIIGCLYGALVAWRQNSLKHLFAYSSLSQVNLILAGLFTMGYTSHSGAIFQSFNHGITITALFILYAWISSRIPTDKVSTEGAALSKTCPQLGWLALFFALSAIALPGTHSFVGELLIFSGLYNQLPWLMLLLGTIIIFSALYQLNWIRQIFFVGPTDQTAATQEDLTQKEFLLALPLIALTILLGIYPHLLLAPIKLFTEAGTS